MNKNSKIYIEDKLYKEIVKDTIIQTLDIVFLNEDNQILLSLRENKPLKGVYYLPGGRRLKNETIKDSAKRKAKEELGLDINVDNLTFLGVYDDIFEDSRYDNIGTHCSGITYIYKLNKKEESSIKNDYQHSELKFFNLNNANLHKMIKMRINDIEKLNIL